MLKKQQHSPPRHYGKESHLCRVTKNANGVIRKYGLLINRRSFREQAKHIGFIKVSWIGPKFCLIALSATFLPELKLIFSRYSTDKLQGG